MNFTTTSSEQPFDAKAGPQIRVSNPQDYLTPQQYVLKWLKLPLMDMMGVLFLFMAGFLMLVNVQIDKDTVALDGQVMLKLLVLAGCGLYGAMGFATDWRIRSTLFSLPVLWMVLIIGFFYIAVMGSITPKESLASAIAMTCVTLMAVTAIVQLGPNIVLTTLFYSLSLFVSLSWVVFLAMPEIGVFAEPTADGQFTMRMSGLAHPNTLGQFSGLTIVLGAMLWVKLGQRSLFRVGIILLAAAALACSMSRTSIMATGFALAISFRHLLFRKKFLFPMVVMMAVTSIGLVALSFDDSLGERIENKLASFSKSGDKEELTTATGRADIWAYAGRLILERPLIGYGAATTKYYLIDYSSYTHNLILNVAFSTGMIGGLLALCMCLGRFVSIFTHSHFVADGIIAFILFNGLFENVMFSFLAGLPTIIWVVALCLPQWMPPVAVTESNEQNSAPYNLRLRPGGSIKS